MILINTRFRDYILVLVFLLLVLYPASFQVPVTLAQQGEGNTDTEPLIPEFQACSERHQRGKLGTR